MTTTEREGTDIAGRIKAARERAAWTLEALAFHSGLSWSAVSQLESGRRRNPRPATLAALASALCVTVDYLIGGASWPPTMLGHHAVVYGDDDGFLAAAVPFLAQGVGRSEALLAVMRASNLQLLEGKLGPNADQVEFIESESWYGTGASALNAYRTFIDERIGAGAPWVRVVGETPSAEGVEETRAWTQYEAIVNLTFALQPVTFLCAYDERVLEPAIIDVARLTHPHTIEDGVIVDNPSCQDPAALVLGPEGALGGGSA